MTLPPDVDGAGPGLAPAERTPTPAPLPAWPEEPGLDNPAFEESPAADGTCALPRPWPMLSRGHLLPPLPAALPTWTVLFPFKELISAYNSPPRQFTPSSVPFSPQLLLPVRTRWHPFVLLSQVTESSPHGLTCHSHLWLFTLGEEMCR